MIADNHIRIDNCTVCAIRMDCSRRFGVSSVLRLADAKEDHAEISCCKMPELVVIDKPRNWKEAEKHLWELLSHYNQYDPKGKLNLIYICELMTRCILKKERTAGLYEEIFSYQEREVK